MIYHLDILEEKTGALTHVRVIVIIDRTDLDHHGAEEVGVIGGEEVDPGIVLSTARTGFVEVIEIMIIDVVIVGNEFFIY